MLRVVKYTRPICTSVCRAGALLVIFVLLSALLPLYTLRTAEASASSPGHTSAEFHVYFPEVPNHTQIASAVQQVNSNGRGHFGLPGGYLLDVPEGVIPTYVDGSAADISLSLERGVTPPVPVPSGLPLESDMVFAGPDQFVFAGPLTMRFPIQNTDDMANIAPIYFDAENSKWRRAFFMGYDPSHPNLVETSVLELGYMSVANLGTAAAASAPIPDGMSANSVAGAVYLSRVHCPQIASGRDCFFYFTVKQMIPKDPTSVNGAALVGQVFRTSANPTGESPVPTIQGLPQGRYTFCVSALESPLTLTYLRKYVNTTPVVININQDYRCTGIGSCTGEIEYAPASGGPWFEASDNNPCQWGPTVASDPASLGRTGEFQATLTWTNADGSTTDVDMHLEGPNGLHISYVAKAAADGSLYLDRDWQSEVGNAVENIYQARDSQGKSIALAQGAYRLYVKHYSGASPKQYQVRVILKGASTTYSGQLSSGETANIVEFTMP